ncbi:MAG: lipocalin family protein [Saprospiraceae bacterium]|jgi:hypothetical protein|nr:lipocalin family protein [Saprospiraceae bacterium]
MKFSHSLSFFLLCTLILSCSKSEESILSNNDLVGTWKLIDFRCDDGKTVTNFLGQTITSTYTSTGKDYAAESTFTENPNTYHSKGSYTSVVTTTTIGTSQTSEVSTGLFDWTGTWKKEGNILTTTLKDQPTEKAEIITLNATTFEYKVSINKVENNGISESTITATYFFKLIKK